MDSQPSTKDANAKEDVAVLKSSVDHVARGKKSRFRRIPKGFVILAIIISLGIIGVVFGVIESTNPSPIANEINSNPVANEINPNPVANEVNPNPVADCEWSGIAFAFIDENEDRVFQKSEHPLPGVTFHVLDRLDQSSEVQTGISEMNGEAELFLFLFGCPQVKYEITADEPAGFRLTTTASLPSKADYGEVFQFGYVYLPGEPTVTPRPNLP